MSEMAINALLTVFMVVIFAAITVVMVVGCVCLVWNMVTDFIDAIQERKEEKGET